MVSVIVSPEEFYVHPIQESRGDQATVERELDSLVQGDKVARTEEVVVGSVWAVHHNHAWCRMKVTRVKGFKCERVNTRSIDYGHCLQDVDVRQLNRLPTGPASMVGGLAVRCYLAMIKHIKNNYMTNDDDLEIATDGYKSKEKVCAFYTNRGHCYRCYRYPSP